MQLCGDLPRRRRLERDPRGALLEAACPHQRRRHVDVRVGRVDREVRAVEAIAPYFVADAHHAAVPRNVPLRRVGTFDGERHSLAVVNPYVVHIPGEIVNGVASGRRARYQDLEDPGRHVGKDHLDLHPVVLGFGKAETV